MSSYTWRKDLTKNDILFLKVVLGFCVGMFIIAIGFVTYITIDDQQKEKEIWAKPVYHYQPTRLIDCSHMQGSGFLLNGTGCQ
jgi:hypothetical protein